MACGLKANETLPYGLAWRYSRHPIAPPQASPRRQIRGGENKKGALKNIRADRFSWVKDSVHQPAGFAGAREVLAGHHRGHGPEHHVLVVVRAVDAIAVLDVPYQREVPRIALAHNHVIHRAAYHVLAELELSVVEVRHPKHEALRRERARVPPVRELPLGLAPVRVGEYPHAIGTVLGIGVCLGDGIE